MLGKMWRNWNTCALMVGVLSDVATVENSMVHCQKVKHRITVEPSNSTPRYIPPIIESRDSNIHLHSHVQCSATLFTKAKR